MQNLSFSRAKTVRGDEYDGDLVEKAQKLRERAKKFCRIYSPNFSQEGLNRF